MSHSQHKSPTALAQITVSDQACWHQIIGICKAVMKLPSFSTFPEEMITLITVASDSLVFDPQVWIFSLATLKSSSIFSLAKWFDSSPFTGGTRSGKQHYLGSQWDFECLCNPVISFMDTSRVILGCRCSICLPVRSCLRGRLNSLGSHMHAHTHTHTHTHTVIIYSSPLLSEWNRDPCWTEPACAEDYVKAMNPFNWPGTQDEL